MPPRLGVPGPSAASENSTLSSVDNIPREPTPGWPVPGRGPRPGGPALVLRSAAQASVLDVLRTSGMPMTVADLSAALHQHPNTVREHLDSLVARGFAVRDLAAPHGRGRPAHRYRSAFAEGMTSPFSYVGLVSALAEHLEVSAGDTRPAALGAGRSWGRRVGGAEDDHAQASAVSPGPIRSRPIRPRTALLRMLDRLGFDPEPVGSRRPDPPAPQPAGPRELLDDRDEIVLRACPVLDVAIRHTTVVCAVHEGMVQGILETLGGPPEATLHPFADPAGCVLRLSGQGASR